MPYAFDGAKAPSKKRKLSAHATVEKTSKKVAAKAKTREAVVSHETILGLEGAIAESPKNYNDIVTLLGHFKDSVDKEPELAVTVAVSLCRTFCRLMAKGRMAKRKGDLEDERTVAVWLKNIYKEYHAELCALLNHEDAAVQNAALTLLMRLLKDEGAHLKPDGEDYYFPHDTFGRIVGAALSAEHLDEEVKAELAEKYINCYDDVRYSFFTAMRRILDHDRSHEPTLPSDLLHNAVCLLLLVKNLPTAETTDLDTFHAIAPPSKSKPAKGKLPQITQLNAHRKAVQEAWCSVLRHPLAVDDCKSVLLAAERRIVPSFTKPQLLMDFLVACYNHGGTISLLALNGLFHLITTKNLDYPNFFPKLYALLDRDVFHVRYRSRFFRLLDTFLASTHLPAALVASFIKRMSRLCLTAPPGAIVAVVPFVYNLFKRHRATTYMMHRPAVDEEEREEWQREGYRDPFDEEETDPLQTRAIESCVWELETLMSHWHPNVATLARIIKEQFTKERYQMEDFLDHNYGSMFDLETGRELKKPPAVEYDIPKKIFFREEGKAEGENLLLDLWSFE